MSTDREALAAQLRPMTLPRMEARPLSSILIANYNYERYLPAALGSALRQTDDNLEIIVCDDGSKDRSVEVVEEFARRDARVRLIRKENGGQASALNCAFQESRGEVLHILDADDVFEADKIRLVLEALSGNPDCGMCVHPVRPVNSVGKPIGPALPRVMRSGWLGSRALLHGGRSALPPASGISFRRAAAGRVFPIPDILRRMADGYVARNLTFFTNVAVIQRPLADYRLHGANVTGATSLSAAVIQKNMGDWRLLIQAQKESLQNSLGREFADCLRMEDLPDYTDQLLAMSILNQDSSPEKTERTRAEMLASLPRRRRLLWRAVFSLPLASLRRAALNFWWGYSPVKALASRLIPVRFNYD